jgi:hypothetical protein
MATQLARCQEQPPAHPATMAILGRQTSPGSANSQRVHFARCGSVPHPVTRAIPSVAMVYPPILRGEYRSERLVARIACCTVEAQPAPHTILALSRTNFRGDPSQGLRAYERSDPGRRQVRSQAAVMMLSASRTPVYPSGRNDVILRHRLITALAHA